MNLTTIRADAAHACVQLAQQLGALQNALFSHPTRRAAAGDAAGVWRDGQVHGALGITANTLSAMAVLLGLDYRQAYGLPQGPTGIEVEAAKRILAEHRASAPAPECGTIASPATPDSAPTQEVAAAGTWDAQAVAESAETALMEESLSAALCVIEESLPHATDPGIDYDNARRRADVLLLLLDLDAVKAAPDTRRRLEQALEQARYVGD